MKNPFNVRPKTANLGLKRLINKHKKEFKRITNPNWDFQNNLYHDPIPAHNMYFDKYSESKVILFFLLKFLKHTNRHK